MDKHFDLLAENLAAAKRADAARYETLKKHFVTPLPAELQVALAQKVTECMRRDEAIAASHARVSVPA